MAASDELPRGWTAVSTFSGSQTPQVIIPAVAGISHILTDVTWVVYTGNAAPTTGYNVFLAVASPSEVLGVISLNTAVFTKDSVTWSGKIMSPTGAAMNVFSGGALPTNMGSFLILQGYDT